MSIINLYVSLLKIIVTLLVLLIQINLKAKALVVYYVLTQ